MNKECLPTCMSKFERKNKSSLQFMGSQQDMQEEEEEAEASRRWYCYCETTHSEDVVRAGDSSLR